MITEKQVFISACGVDDNNDNNSIVKIESKYLNVTTNEEESVRELTIDGPVLNIFRSLRSTMVDLTFSGNSDYDFINAYTLLKEFCIPQNSLDENAEKIPCIQLTVMPKKLEGMYYLCGIHCTWCIMASDSGKLPDTIRFIFDNDLFHTYRLNEKALDEDQIEEELFMESYT